MPEDHPDQDETRPLPHTYRYGPESAQAAQGPQAADAGPYESSTGSTAVGPRRGRAVTAGIVGAAVLVGGLAGVGGAAGYHALAEPGGSGQQPTASGSQVNTPVAPTSDSGKQDEPVQQVAASVLPSVVKIDVVGQQGAGSGSGIILGQDGEILTNNHVVEVAGQSGTVTVSFNDGSTAKATVVGTDPVTDIAVIKAQGVHDLTPATLGHSGKLDVGEGVVAVGSPFGLDATVTSGIVSALNRPVSVGSTQGGLTQQQGTNQATIYPAIQTDAAINPGNSGGPLLNMQGQVVGINSSIRTSGSSSVMGSEGGSIGLGFSIPIDEILPVIDQIRNGQDPTHARLGVTVSDVQSDSGLVNGAEIHSVDTGTAGDQAGLRQGDVVTKVDGDLITGADSLVATIRGYRPGEQVTLTVKRSGTDKEVQATLGSDAHTTAS